jgi:hypothetical protein
MGGVEMSATAERNGSATARAAEAAPEPRLPVFSFTEARMLLRRPFTPAAVKWKIQGDLGTSRALIVGYIDARLVIERLNLVVGGEWSAEYEPLGGGLMWCHLSVFDITRRDVGEGRGKALVSDALKRAAVHFGVGVSLYAIPQAIMSDGTGPGQLRKTRKGRFFLDERNEAFLRDRYARWLSAAGIEAFGEPFDHGDAEGSLGDPDTLPDAEAPDHDAVSDEDADRYAALARRACAAGLATKQKILLALTAAGATDTSSITRAFATAPPREAGELASSLAETLAAAQANGRRGEAVADER